MEKAGLFFVVRRHSGSESKKAGQKSINVSILMKICIEHFFGLLIPNINSHFHN